MLDNKIISKILLTSLACQGSTEEQMEWSWYNGTITATIWTLPGLALLINELSVQLNRKIPHIF